MTDQERAQETGDAPPTRHQPEPPAPASDGVVRTLLRDNLLWAITALVGVLATTLVGLWAAVPAWAIIVAALAALVGCVLGLMWLRGPADRWRTALVPRATALGCCLLVALGALTFGAWRGHEVAPGNPATLLVLDASAAMDREFAGDGDTALTQATATIVRHVRSLSGRQLGLGIVGAPDCGESPPLDVPVAPAKDTAKDIKAAAREVADRGGQGESTLVSGVRNAITRLDGFTGARRVIVVAGGVDSCGDRLADLVEDIQADPTTALTWDVVGVGLSDEDKGEYAELDAPNVTVRTPDTAEELDEVLDFLLYEQEIREEFDALEQYVSEDTRVPVNKVIDAMGDRDTDAMTRHLDTVEKVIEQGEERFDSLMVGDDFAPFMPIKSRLRKQFDSLRQGTEVLGEIRDFDVAHDGELSEAEQEERDRLVDRLRSEVDRYNGRIDALYETLQEVLEELFDTPGG